MEKLLRWSIDAAQDPANAGTPDPEMLAKLFGTGGDDEANMKLTLRTAVESDDQILRVEALETFEELIENIDNANNMGKLWEPLIYLISDRNPEIRRLAISTVGSAVQNNEKAQKDLLTTGSGLPTVMEHLTDADEQTAAKAVYALSSAVGHNPDAYDIFAFNNGWDALNYIFEHVDPSGKLTKPQLRALTLVYQITLLESSRPVLGALRQTNIVPDLAKIYATTDEHTREKIDHIFDSLQHSGYAFERPRV